jgi:hypothetical protein
MIDLSVTVRDEPSWFNAAPFVLEMLGFVRLERCRHPRDARGRVLVVPESALPDADPDRHDLVICESDPDPRHPGAAPLPDTITLVQPLQDACRPFFGLYSSLDNYNGIRGVTDPMPVPTPFWRDRRPRPVELPDLPPPLREPAASIAVRGDPLAWRSDGSAVISRQGRVLRLGVPLLSILSARSTCPTFPADCYRFCEPVDHLASLLGELLMRFAGAGVLRVRPWPNDAPLSITIRHDLDRPSPLAEALAREADLGLRTTVYALDGLPPNEDEIAAARRADAEFGLHTTYLREATAHADSLTQCTGRVVRSVSAHGGVGDGWQGLHNLTASDAAGFETTELLSEMRVWPHRVPRPDRPGSAFTPLALPHHLSYDLSRHDHDESRLLAEIPVIARLNGHLTLMNHPDIHLDGFLRMLERSIPKNATAMTHAELGAWWRASHTAGALRTEAQGGRLLVHLTDAQRCLAFDLSLDPDSGAIDVRSGRLRRTDRVATIIADPDTGVVEISHRF